MKATVTTSILFAVGVVVLFYVVQGLNAALFAALISAVIIYVVIRHRRNLIKQRNEWKADPIPPEMEKFDAFFWNQLICQQNWYLENIYSQGDIRKLIYQYSHQIKKIWNDEEISVEDKVDMTRGYLQRIEALEYHLIYINLQSHP